VKNFHLVGDKAHIDDLGQIGVKALEGPARNLGIESARRNLMGGEIIEERPRDGRFPHATLVRADNDNCWLCHFLGSCRRVRLNGLFSRRRCLLGNLLSAPWWCPLLTASRAFF